MWTGLHGLCLPGDAGLCITAGGQGQSSGYGYDRPALSMLLGALAGSEGFPNPGHSPGLSLSVQVTPVHWATSLPILFTVLDPEPLIGQA